MASPYDIMKRLQEVNELDAAKDDIIDVFANVFDDTFVEYCTTIDLSSEMQRGIVSFLLCLCASSHFIEDIDEASFLKFCKKMRLLLSGQLEVVGSLAITSNATNYKVGFMLAHTVFKKFQPYDEEFAEVFEDNVQHTLSLFA